MSLYRLARVALACVGVLAASAAARVADLKIIDYGFSAAFKAGDYKGT